MHLNVLAHEDYEWAADVLVPVKILVTCIALITGSLLTVFLAKTAVVHRSSGHGRNAVLPALFRFVAWVVNRHIEGMQRELAIFFGGSAEPRSIFSKPRVTQSHTCKESCCESSSSTS